MPGLTQNDVLLFVGIAVAIALVAFLSLRSSKSIDLVEHPPDDSPGLHLGGAYPEAHRPTSKEKAAADADFDETFYSGVWHFVDRYFHTKIAGAKYLNDNGTSRVAVIKHCKPSEVPVIQWEKGNRYDRYAKIVKRQNGQQLGYLARNIGEEIHDDFFVPGVTWLGIFKCTNHHPETGQVVGANILLARKTPEKSAKENRRLRKLRRAKQMACNQRL